MRENGVRPAMVVCVHGAGGGGWEWGDLGARAGAARLRGDRAGPDAERAAGIEKTSFMDYRSQVMDWCAGAARASCLLGASLGGLLALVGGAARASRRRSCWSIRCRPRACSRGRFTSMRPPVVPWARERSLASTRRAMPDADDAARLFALRRWRDESGAVLNEARDGIAVETPRCPTLLIARASSTPMSRPPPRARLRCGFRPISARLPGASHVGPLLGRNAADSAAQAADWLAARMQAMPV